MKIHSILSKLVILSVLLVFPAVTPATTYPDLETEILDWQPTTDAFVVGVQADGTRTGVAVLVYNYHGATLTNIRVGCALVGSNGSTIYGTWISSNMSVSVASGALAKLTITGPMASDAVLKLAANSETNGYVVWGVVTASWSDSTSFNIGSNSFSNTSRTAVDSAFANFSTTDLDTAMPPLTEASNSGYYYKCVDSVTYRRKYCANVVSSCDTKKCPNPDECPDQGCQKITTSTPSGNQNYGGWTWL